MIGIPYSSDAAEDTEEEDEECVLNKITKYMFVIGWAVAVAFVLSA